MNTDLYVGDGDEVSWFLQAVEASSLHELPHELVGDLIAPLVDDRHVDVVDEHGHLLASRRSIHAADPLVHVALDGSLWKRGARHPEAFTCTHMLYWLPWCFLKFFSSLHF